MCCLGRQTLVTPTKATVAAAQADVVTKQGLASTARAVPRRLPPAQLASISLWTSTPSTPHVLYDSTSQAAVAAAQANVVTKQGLASTTRTVPRRLPPAQLVSTSL